MRNLTKAFCAALFVLAVLCSRSFAEKGLTVKAVRYFSYAGFTRVVFEIEATAPYVVVKSADGRSVILRSYEGVLTVLSPIPAIRDASVSGIELKDEEGSRYILINLNDSVSEVKDFVLRGPDRIVLDIMRGGASAAQGAERQAVIILDPGHGGAKDPGIVTSRGAEKALTLEWAQALKKHLKKTGIPLNSVLTREKDQPLTLNERAGLSNAARSAVFISLHAAPGSGVRVYLLDPSEESASRISSGRGDFLGYEAESGQKEMLWQRQQAGYAQESGTLGRMIAGRLDARDGAGPVQAPLAALRPVAAAAVVVEIGVEANVSRMLEEIAKGIERYVRERR